MYLLRVGVVGSCRSPYQPTQAAILTGYWVTITSVTLRWNLAGLFGVYMWRADRGLRAGLGWEYGSNFGEGLRAKSTYNGG
jgi:hypothetical protein